ncbi:hypothetical protein B0T10DRAFT_321424 [Thelonectria olida]|uniref:Uncharacterized protein n=1 Tax=Thelonectria olida TaxID=1576542 RepID=A0A9P9AMM7_9HYPO|nr:hypothetical protein B0T10DRAFT_321424 [Thelonectria olida]
MSEGGREGSQSAVSAWAWRVRRHQVLAGLAVHYIKPRSSAYPAGAPQFIDAAYVSLRESCSTSSMFMGGLPCRLQWLPLSTGVTTNGRQSTETSAGFWKTSRRRIETGACTSSLSGMGRESPFHNHRRSPQACRPGRTLRHGLTRLVESSDGSTSLMSSATAHIDARRNETKPLVRVPDRILCSKQLGEYRAGVPVAGICRCSPDR